MEDQYEDITLELEQLLVPEAPRVPTLVQWPKEPETLEPSEPQP